MNIKNINKHCLSPRIFGVKTLVLQSVSEEMLKFTEFIHF